jgi:protein-arginine deiminase
MAESRVRLFVDSLRTGEVARDGDGRWQWEWGDGKRGAVVVLDPGGGLAVERSAPVVLSVEPALARAPDCPEVTLSLSSFAAARVTLWYLGSDGPVPLVGARADRLESVTVRAVEEAELRLTAHTFPDGGFDGLVEVMADMRDAGGGDRDLYRDRAVLRVAPWVMPGSSRPPEALYVVHATGWNSDFVAALGDACTEAGVPLREVAGEFADGDPWIQDEVEPGHTWGPADPARHVIVDGPRDRGLDPAVERVFGRDGVDVYSVPAHGGWATSLDSFGNLEVSPPVTVAGVPYPLGRIVLGTTAPGDDGRQAALAVRQFLNAQQVQAPIEAYTDWLVVGHVDEIVCFEPGAGAGGGDWQIQIASPAAFRSLLEGWAAGGHGEAVLWEGKVRPHPVTGREVKAARSVRELLADDALWAFQGSCQAALDVVRRQLADGLGVGPERFVDVPVVFESLDGAAVALFPDMVNHIVVGDWSIVPDPFGPVVDGVDLLQEAYRALAPHRRHRFVDDWYTYHLNLGEVHCGTNVLRTPDPDARWWATRLPGLWDALAPG